MNLDQTVRTARALYESRPSTESPAHELWLRTVDALVAFIEVDNRHIDPEAVRRHCMTGKP